MKDGSSEITTQLMQLILQSTLDAVVTQITTTTTRLVAHTYVERSPYETQVATSLTGHGAGVVVEREFVTHAKMLLCGLEEIPTVLHCTLSTCKYNA